MRSPMKYLQYVNCYKNFSQHNYYYEQLIYTLVKLAHLRPLTPTHTLLGKTNYESATSRDMGPSLYLKHYPTSAYLNNQEEVSPRRGTASHFYLELKMVPPRKPLVLGTWFLYHFMLCEMGTFS